MQKSYLVRAHSLHVEAGLLDKLKSAAKKTVMILLGVGFLTSVAQGRSISKSGLEKSAKEFNQAKLGLTLKTSYTPGKAGNSGKVVYLYTDNLGGKAEVIFIQNPNGNYLDSKVYKPTDGSPVNEDLTYAAQETYKFLHAAMVKEGIELKNK